MINYTNNNQNNSTMNITNTSNDTDELDNIIMKIQQLKATPQSAARDSEIQALTARRNYLAAL